MRRELCVLCVLSSLFFVSNVDGSVYDALHNLRDRLWSLTFNQDRVKPVTHVPKVPVPSTTALPPRTRQTQTLRLFAIKNDVCLEGAINETLDLNVNISDKLDFSCELDKVDKDYIVTLYHERNGNILLNISMKADNKFNYTLKAEVIDNNTAIYCTAHKSGSKEHFMTSRIVNVILDDASNATDQFAETYFHDQVVEYDCDGNDTVTILNSDDSFNSTINEGYKLTMENNGSLVFCTDIQRKYINNNTQGVQRMINNRTIYNKRKYMYIEVKVTSRLYLPIIGGSFGSVLVILILAVKLCIRCRKKGPDVVADVTPPLEPDFELYTTPNQIIYADLALEEIRTSRNRIEEATPYAEVVGYLSKIKNK